MIRYSVGVATWLPRWWIDIATTIHDYEAILATLANLVWHFYHVIFDPDVYPMSWTWLDGKGAGRAVPPRAPARRRGDGRGN